MLRVANVIFAVSLLSACLGFLYEPYTVLTEDIYAVKFYLYKRNVTREEHRVRASDLISSSFDPKLKTYFTSHGWKGSDPKGRLSAMKKVVKALIEKEDCNVFNLDWNYWAQNADVNAAASYTKRVGRITAEFIKLLEQQFNVSRTNMHIIGFSLGGQVVSHVGASLQSPKLGRITGLDSAEHGCTTSTECLDPSDATFVDEIHTAISKTPKGHADFQAIHRDDLPVNKHGAAPYYFAKSISGGPCSYLATECSSNRLFNDGQCKNNPTNHMGLFAVKPDTLPPNWFRLNVDWEKPC